MTKRTVAIAASLGVFLFLALGSCQEFFTSSLASYAARDGYAIPSDISVEEASELLARSSGDPAMASALVAPLAAAAAAAVPGSAEYYQAADVLLDAVLVSSGVGPSMIGALAVIQSDPDAAMEIMLSVALSDTEVAALALVAGDPIFMSAEEMYTVALALMSEAVRNVGIADPLAITDPEYHALILDGAYTLAQAYITMADAMVSTPMTQMEQLMSGLIPVFEDPIP